MKNALITDNISDLKLLLARDKTLNNKVVDNGLTPIFFAKSKEACEVLNNNGASLDQTATPTALSPLIVSVISDRKQVTKFLLTHDVNVNYEDASGRTALFWALEKGKSLETIQMLVDGGADVNYVSSKTKKSALDYANSKIDPNVIEYIKGKQEAHRELDKGAAKYRIYDVTSIAESRQK